MSKHVPPPVGEPVDALILPSDIQPEDLIRKSGYRSAANGPNRASSKRRCRMSEKLVDQNYPDTFVCELSKVERIGTNRRLIFTVPSIEGDGFRMVVDKLIVPADYMVTLA
jgi:hypothetical protein